MIDIRDLRERPEAYKKNYKKKGYGTLKGNDNLIDEVLALDKEWRGFRLEVDKLRYERNKISGEINEAKKNKEDKKAKELIIKAKKIPGKMKKLEVGEKKALQNLNQELRKIPNLMHDKVPHGHGEKENVVEKVYGKPKKKNFKVKSHVEISESLGVANFEDSARVAGNGFYYLEGDLALLNQALINYSRDFMVGKGFTYVETPLMLKEEIIDQVTDLNDKKNQIYLMKDTDLALIGTSEHSLIGRFAGQEINWKKLPIKHTSYSMCFRKEIGSHGLDEKGLFRTHQFNKVEMIVICRPEESGKFFEEMKKISVDLCKNLGVPIRVLKICSGDLGDLKHEQIDIEAYSPRKKDYFEVGSCSNLTDAQARKLGISTRIKNQRVVPHTLNNTALATSRIMVAILENHQNKDGSVSIPRVLQKYMGKKKIEVKKKSK